MPSGARGELLCHSAAMIRRQAVLGIGGYSADTEPAEDLDLFLRLAEVGRLADLAEPETMYRST